MKTAQPSFLNHLIGGLVLLGSWLPLSLTAQRFNHPAGSAAPVNPPAQAHSAPISVVPTAPAPNYRPTPVPMPAAARARELSAVSHSSVTINGGSKNYGNHDYKGASRINPHSQNIPAALPNPPGWRNEDPSVFHSRNIHAAHPYVFHPYQPHYWGPRWHPIGFFLTILESSAILFSVGSQSYYYDDGCYYIPYRGGYSVVPPPVGAMVSYLPDGYETIVLGDDTYYYYGGVFYILINPDYQVVEAPVGAVVSQLPEGAIEQVINGESLLVYNNAYYQPIVRDGQDAYEVVKLN